MFTGIIEELGRIREWHPHAKGARLVIECEQVLTDAREGCSIAVNGVCLTALDLQERSFAADLAPETLQRSNLGSSLLGDLVNLERPMMLNDRLSGHIVQGHVDATGELIRLEELGDGNWWLTVEVPERLHKFLVEKGSITMDGISLTVAKLEDPYFSVAIIPHTYQVTNLKNRKAGDRVNLEADFLAKHVERLMSYQKNSV
jgi:riboflavin synthase